MIEADAAILAERIRTDFPAIAEPMHWIWTQSPPLKTIDCVLSLRKNYTRIVEPRVKRFAAAHPEIADCASLRSLIDRSPSPVAFFAAELAMNSPGKAAALVGVLDYLLDIQRRFDGATEDARLAAWARWARPGDYLTLDVRGFGLAGFQYLRMLMGADTVKPDVHVLRYVERVLGRPVTASASQCVQAVYALERAGELLGHPVKSIDVAIWSLQRQGPTP
jgi:hypothetical protein